MKFTKNRKGFTLVELLVVITIIATLAGIAFPVMSEVQTRGRQTAALANAKQIGTSCKLFATDYDGRFPSKVNEDENEASPLPDATSSNDAFNTLIPTYGCTENLFYTQTSAWSSKKGDGDKNLESGENNYSYFGGLSESDNSEWPLICDGWKEGNVGIYATDPATTGGVWKGRKAIVIRVDGSGKVENLRGGTDPKFLGRTSDTEENGNMLKPNAGNGWLSKAVGKELAPLK